MSSDSVRGSTLIYHHSMERWKIDHGEGDKQDVRKAATVIQSLLLLANLFPSLSTLRLVLLFNCYASMLIVRGTEREREREIRTRHEGGEVASK